MEAVSVRDIRAINPARVADLFDSDRQQFFIDLAAVVNPAFGCLRGLYAAGEMPCVFAKIGKQPYFLAGC